MAFWPHFNLHASTKGQEGHTHTQWHTHPHTPSHTHQRGSNCRWQHFTRGVWQVRQVRIKVGRKDTPPPPPFAAPAAAFLLQPLPNAPWGHFWYILFLVSLFFSLFSSFFFSTCTKHLPSIFADTFYIVLSPLPLSTCFGSFLVVISFSLSPVLMAYSASQVNADWLGQPLSDFQLGFLLFSLLFSPFCAAMTNF